MNDVMQVESAPDVEIQRSTRNKIVQFEESLSRMPGAVFGDQESCPLKHSFADGIYMREIFIPKGTVLVGKIHRFAHPRVILSGEIIQFSESGGREYFKGPISMISPAGSKRAIVALTDYVAITFHNVGEERDLDKIEKMIIAESYEELEGGIQCLG